MLLFTFKADSYGQGLNGYANLTNIFYAKPRKSYATGKRYILL